MCIEQCAIIIGSTVFLFNFSTCLSNEIQTDDVQKPVFYRHTPQTPTRALLLDPAGGRKGGLPSPRLPALLLYPLPLHGVQKMSPLYVSNNSVKN